MSFNTSFKSARKSAAMNEDDFTRYAPNEFPRALRDLRKKKRLSQKCLGELCGFFESTISKYERGKNKPGPYALCRLAEALGTSVDRLLGRRE